MGMPSTAVRGFFAGALSVITAMAATWWLMRAGGYMPANANPLWSWTPPVAPFGIPRVINVMFWGGVWGLVLSLLFRGLSGAKYWLAWFIAGAIAVAGTAIFIVPMIKGEAMRALTAESLLRSGFLNGMFGLGAGLWNMILGGMRRDEPVPSMATRAGRRIQ